MRGLCCLRLRIVVPLLALVPLLLPASVSAHQDGDDKRLPVIGPAPPFALTSQDGKPVALAAFARQGRGRDLHLHRVP